MSQKNAYRILLIDDQEAIHEDYRKVLGKQPPASKYSADMSKHAFLGSHERIKQVQKDYASKL
jgi:hypothetical protein